MACRSACRRLLLATAGTLYVFVLVIATRLTASQTASPPSPDSQRSQTALLEDDPAIAYATGPVTDRVAMLSRAIASGHRALTRDASTGYLRSLLRDLGVAEESQLLTFAKTGVQRQYTNPQNPRALYYDRSVAVGYVAGAPLIEIASHDPRQGVIFYTLEQQSDPPVLKRATSCLMCHVSATTLYVPGLIVRSNSVNETGEPLPQLGSYDVDHRTPHPDRWGGWFVTSDAGAVPYAQRAHGGNITYSAGGITSNQVFIDWINSSPETRGYLSPLSDIVSLLVFDHEAHAINLLTRVNWESRAGAADGELQRLTDELADYLLFAREVPPSVPLIARAGFAEQLMARTPKDRRGRSLAELDLDRRLFRYPCSLMMYSEAFDGLPAGIKRAIYRRLQTALAGTAEGRAALEILRDTKSDFPSDE